MGDILENILSNSPDSSTPRQDETVLLDDEIKKIINEMKNPPLEKNLICTKGVGDQLGGKSELTPVLAEPSTKLRNTLERKNRLTNLVRNSKQMLTKFVTTSDNTNEKKELKCARSEEKYELVIKVVDFDSINSDDNFVCKFQGNSENRQGAQDTGMDVIDLEGGCSQGVVCEGDKGDVIADVPPLIEDLPEKILKDVCPQPNKKKWNFGAKFLRLFKKHPRQQEQKTLSDSE